MWDICKGSLCMHGSRNVLSLMYVPEMVHQDYMHSAGWRIYSVSTAGALKKGSQVSCFFPAPQPVEWRSVYPVQGIKQLAEIPEDSPLMSFTEGSPTSKLDGSFKGSMRYNSLRAFNSLGALNSLAPYHSLTARS